MEKIVLVQVDASVERQIRRLAENKKIQVVSVGTEAAGKTVDEIIHFRNSTDDVSAEKMTPGNKELLPSSSLMIFSDVSEKHFDKLLFEMREKRIAVELKAVVTPTNRSWSLGRLYTELEKEKIFYLNRNR